MAKKEDTEPAKLFNAMTTLIDLRKAQLEEASKSKLKYESIYNNLDRILSQLPEPVVEDLNMQFQQLAYNALKNYQEVVIIERNELP